MLTLMGISGHDLPMAGTNALKLRGAAIREAYGRMGLTRSAFAEKAGVTPRTLTNVTTVSGRPGPCSLATAARIAQALGWTLEEVLDDAADGDSFEGTSPADNGIEAVERRAS